MLFRSNRYSDPGSNRRFVLGIDRSKMRLYDVEQSGQNGVTEDRPVMDRGKFMQEDTERSLPKPKFDKKKFEGFK